LQTIMTIPFPIQLDILDFIFKGILIGIIASAPMGPVGILCIQRTLNKGRWYGEFYSIYLPNCFFYSNFVFLYD
jgi:hypothetical protein